jgi:hypothetical protein
VGKKGESLEKAHTSMKKTVRNLCLFMEMSIDGPGNESRQSEELVNWLKRPEMCSKETNSKKKHWFEVYCILPSNQRRGDTESS